ncbi:uncharacterized protein LOC113218400 [Frankliniella occidentalis]|uniref:Uncharacterized protein LOC113218400 n=1 Tax=Frankliniella occidentalis TaxID=133901 RepID=A0A6J1TV94_FRAOC|nr:uncharacterized protein LOC113218400 [Frankliniella occidentalis]XP_026294525.1 uncharacterized protein LOC113218400 [Frankliniella occidentalis]XP_026294526.1 uncharacterized protein LOC113218400 [Frankliniella occidentalis]
MATLKGLFEPKPRCQRNFLLENKRDVKAKSTSNRERNNISTNYVPQNLRASIRPLPARSASFERPKLSGCQKNNPKPLHRSKPDLNTKLSDNLSLELMERHLSRDIKTGQAAHYIHQENVPFQWTEVCPSLISHNICHQSVQTEENSCGNLSKRLEHFSHDGISTAECDSENNHPSNISNASGGNSQTTSNTDKNRCPKATFVKTESDNNNHQEGPEVDSKTFSLVEDIKDINKKKISKKLASKEDAISVAHSDKVRLNHSLNHSTSGIASCVVSDLESATATTSRKLTSVTKTSSHAQYPSSYQKGEIPKYLCKRKTEQALASARAKEIDPSCPPGHVAMPDAERRETLDMILKNYNKLITELNKIPVRTDTLKMKQRKIEIEKQLDKLEEGIRIFSRSKVYVKVDA